MTSVMLPLSTSTLLFLFYPSLAMSPFLCVFFIALAWQRAQSQGGGVRGRQWEGWLVQQLTETVIILCKGRAEGPVTDAQHKAHPDWLIGNQCAILGGALWLVKGGGSAERCKRVACVLVFFQQLSSSYVKKGIRAEEGTGSVTGTRPQPSLHRRLLRVSKGLQRVGWKTQTLRTGASAPSHNTRGDPMEPLAAAVICSWSADQLHLRLSYGL